MDDLRAMREAHFAKVTPRTPRPAAAPVAPPARRSTPARASQAGPAGQAREPAADTGPAAEEACGHRNMSGRTCTREAGHAAKNHRYS